MRGARHQTHHPVRHGDRDNASRGIRKGVRLRSTFRIRRHRGRHAKRRRRACARCCFALHRSHRRPFIQRGRGRIHPERAPGAPHGSLEGRPNLAGPDDRNVGRRPASGRSSSSPSGPGEGTVDRQRTKRSLGRSHSCVEGRRAFEEQRRRARSGRHGRRNRDGILQPGVCRPVRHRTGRRQGERRRHGLRRVLPVPRRHRGRGGGRHCRRHAARRVRARCGRH